MEGASGAGPGTVETLNDPRQATPGYWTGKLAEAQNAGDASSSSTDAAPPENSVEVVAQDVPAESGRINNSDANSTTDRLMEAHPRNCTHIRRGVYEHVERVLPFTAPFCRTRQRRYEEAPGARTLARFAPMLINTSVPSPKR